MESLFSTILIGLFLLSPILLLYLGKKKTACVHILVFLPFLYFWTKVMAHIGERAIVNAETII
ncbi:hypothetical protein [Shouchella miscanthi]|nr:hypothetical protein [Shouchella miscanthi]